MGFSLGRKKPYVTFTIKSVFFRYTDAIRSFVPKLLVQIYIYTYEKMYKQKFVINPIYLDVCFQHLKFKTSNVFYNQMKP